MTGIFRAAAVATTLAVALSACQTTSDEMPSGAAIGAVGGGVYGATSGAISTGTGGGTLLGLVVGVVVGGVAGNLIIPSLSDADRAAALDAARRVSEDPESRRVHWENPSNEKVFGWAELAPQRQPDDGCKLIRIYSYAGGEEQAKTVRFCRRDGVWGEA